MREWSHWGALAGALAPPLLLLVLLGATAVQWPELRELGWSVRERNEVGWPSILTLGSVGWIVTLAFIVCGILGLAFATSLHHVLRGTGPRFAAVLIALVSAALVFAAFRPDPPGSSERSWHAQVHDLAYPVIPLGSIAAASILAWSLWSQPGWSGQARLALAALMLMVAAFLLTGLDATGQLARYVLFGTLLLWLELLALSTLDTGQEG